MQRLTDARVLHLLGSWSNPEGREARKEEATEGSRVPTHQVHPPLREHRRRCRQEALAELQPSVSEHRRHERCFREAFEKCGDAVVRC